MNLLESFLPAPQTVLYLGNIALAVLCSSGVALLAAFACRRRSVPTCCGLLLLGLSLVLASPALVWLAGRAGVGRLDVVLSQQPNSSNRPDILPGAQQTALVAEENQPVVVKKGVRERPASGEDLSAISEAPAAIIEEPRAVIQDRAAIVPVEPPHHKRSTPVRPVDHSVGAAAPMPAATMPWWWSIAQGLVLVWALGTATSLVALVRGFVRLAAFQRSLQECSAVGLRSILPQAALQAGLTRIPSLLVSARTVTPLTLGLFRSAIVLPQGLEDDLSPTQLHAVLLHEMGHVARRDPWVGLAQRLATVLYWWCPLVHLLNRHLADLREELCDNYVLCNSADGAELAEVLVTLAERVVETSPLPGTVSMLKYQRNPERTGSLEYRIRRLLSTETNPMTRMNRVGIASVVLGGLAMIVVISLAHVRAASGDAPGAASGASAPPAQSVSAPITSQNDSEASAASAPANSPAAEEVESARAKRIAKIESVGGRVEFAEDRPGRPVTDIVLYRHEFTDADLEPLEVFDNLQWLHLCQPQITESELTHLPELKQLKTLYLVRMPVSNTFLKSLQKLPQLQELRLALADVSDANLEQIATLSQLKTLSFRRTPVSDTGLGHLAALTQLESLNLDQSLVTDVGMKYLSQLTRLQLLDLASTKVTDAGLRHLAGLTELRALDLSDTQITGAELKHLGNLTQLTDLDLGATEVDDASLQHLSGLTQLTRLDLSGTGVTDAGLRHLRGMDQLEYLQLGSLVTGDGLEHLSNCTALVELDLYGTKVTDASLRHVGGLTRMTSLNLTGTQITDAGLEELSELTELQYLKLSGTQISESGLKHISGLRKVEYLDLPKIPLSDTGLAYLAGLSQLRELDVQAGSVTDQGLRHLRGLTQLVNLNLTDTQITDAGLEHVGGLKNLTILGLARTKVTGAGLVHLRGLTQFLNLDFAETQVTDDGLAHLRGLSKLAVLDLRGTPVTDVGIAHLQDLNLVWLKLGGLPVTDAGLAHLRGHTRLELLHLDGTQVTDEGLKYLVGMKALQTLWLHRTAVTGTGLVHLTGLPRLESVSLNSTADAAAVWRFKKEQPKVQIYPKTLAWGWDNPARTVAVHATLDIQRLLEDLVDDTRIDFIHTPLTDVVAKLEAQHEIVIQLDSPSLRASGVGADTPVTQMIRGITLHSGLRLTLGELGLSYVLRDDALVITTQQEARRLMQQGFINAEEVEHELKKEGDSRRQGPKTVDVLLKETQFQFAATPLVDVVTQLNRQHDIPIEIDQRVLALAGISPDVPCTLEVEGVPLAAALRTLLDKVGLVYVVDDESIRITAVPKVAPAQ